MILNSSILASPFFPIDNPLNIVCSRCQKGVLLRSTHIRDKTADTKIGQKERNFNRYEYEERVCHLLICNNTGCKESYLVVGNEFEDIEYEYDEDNDRDEQKYVLVFQPLFFNPTLSLFNIHKLVPKPIELELMKSFNVFFSDSSSAANKVRIALELLMDELNVPKTGISRKGKQIDLDLHSRIVEFEKGSPLIGEQLLSIKLVGNSGSHSSGIDRTDVVAAYEIIEHVLDELFVRNQRMLEAQLKAKQLNSKGSQLKSSKPIPPSSPLSPPLIK